MQSELLQPPNWPKLPGPVNNSHLTSIAMAGFWMENGCCPAAIPLPRPVP